MPDYDLNIEIFECLINQDFDNIEPEPINVSDEDEEAAIEFGY